MPQTIGKNIWKYNPRLQPTESPLRINNANVKLKNSIIEETGIVEGEEIEYSRIRKSEEHKWKIQAAKEDADELKFTVEILPKISMQCIKIVTEDRPRTNIVFRQPEESSEKDMVCSPDKFQTKYKVQCPPTTAKQREIARSKTNKQYDDSILVGFNPTKFNPRRVKSSTAFHKKNSIISETEKESGLVIVFTRKKCRPFTANSYRSEVEAQARSKSALEIINRERFNLSRGNQQRICTLKESKEANQELDLRVRQFCEKIEQFKRDTFLACEYANGIVNGNSLEKRLNILLKAF